MCAVVLAAGSSKRMVRPKLLLPYGDSTLLQRAVGAALEAGLGRTIVVLGHAASQARHLIMRSWPGRDDLEIVFNPDYHSGMSTSLRAGLAAAAGRAKVVVFCLGDQPLVTGAIIRRLAEAYLGTTPLPLIVAPRCAGQRGNPVLIDERLFPELLKLTGDVGAREVVEAHLGEAVLVDSGPEVLVDMDTPEDLAQLR
ncbi:MAG: nucleotidyltransferase family protein [Firmicutes bacterium]|nr:nucleotidyltransferase family protein [Bacillota bacterium]